MIQGKDFYEILFQTLRRFWPLNKSSSSLLENFEDLRSGLYGIFCEFLLEILIECFLDAVADFRNRLIKISICRWLLFYLSLESMVGQTVSSSQIFLRLISNLRTPEWISFLSDSRLDKRLEGLLCESRLEGNREGIET